MIYIDQVIFTFVLESLVLVTARTQNPELIYSILEESPRMTLIGNILEDSHVRDLVSPKDLPDLRFSFLAEKHSQNFLLWINPNSGELRTSSRINREAICQKPAPCELKVQAVIQAQIGAFFKIIQIKIIVSDINDNAPVFTPFTYTLKISENETPGSHFRLPLATDLDASFENSIIEYNNLATAVPFTLIVDGNATSSFEIHLRLDGSLDRETISSCQFLVRAVDGGMPRLTGSLTVNIDVIDVNDNSPVFQEQQYRANISDSMNVDSLVVVVKATDLDASENGLVTYILPAFQENMALLEMFYVNSSTGDVKTKVLLDSYAGRSYRLVIEARDAGTPYKTSRTEVVIDITDTHNSQPEILLNVFRVDGIGQVSELAELGRAVAHVAVTDPDSIQSPNGQVTCLLNYTDQFLLQPMDVNQFKVVLASRLDREQLVFHSVTVICEDSGTPPINASSSFIVEVQDENDNAPVFDSLYYNVVIVEGRLDTGKSEVILRVQAFDKDAGSNAQFDYRLAEATDSDFGIYTDGSILVTNPTGLDREDNTKGAERTLVVLAVDKGKIPLTGTATVLVTIDDLNDNSPRFSEPLYTLSVTEDSAVNYSIGNVSATDPDHKNNGTVNFKIHQRYLHIVPFEVSLEGIITLKSTLDRETKSSYQFPLVAFDMGKPLQLSSTVLIQVTVTDINDNSPQILFPNIDNYTSYIPYTLTERMVFTKVLAKDIDEANNGELIYIIESCNGSTYFEIDHKTGHVFLNQPLSIKDIGLYVLDIVVKDCGLDTQMISKSQLHIIVYEDNATHLVLNEAMAPRNIVVVAALLAFTTILSLTIFVTILLIRRMDKQRRLYSSKVEEAKAGFTHLKHCPVLDKDPGKSVSGMIDIFKNSEKKRKVSFSLGGEANLGNKSSYTMTTFSPAISETYDSVSGRNCDIVKFKSSITPQEDGRIYASNEVSTCDSGKGGSYSELQSVAGATKDAGDVSFISLRSLDANNQFNISSTVNSINFRSVPNPSKSMKPENKYLQPIPTGFSVFSLTPPTSHWTSQSRSSNRPYFIASHHFYNRTKCNPASTVNTNYINNNNSSNGRQSISPNQMSDLRGNQNTQCTISTNENKGYNLTEQGTVSSTKGSFISLLTSSNQMSDLRSNQITRYINSTNNNKGYILAERRPTISPITNSNLNSVGAGKWDGDTTTSGSYTVETEELPDVTDELFCVNRDVLV